ncbi:MULTISPECIES: hypothetical protein [unclassified Phyllobacterium]|uniref:hypothetical protein n=1 Tax=unclassified Phyllobacterium TaxID=2638441 RepID=UPI00301301DF
MTKHTFTRNQLYGLVWTRPMIAIARELAISNLVLAKICREHDIPTPPAGHWMKLEFGKPSAVQRLPEHRSKEEIVVIPVS